MSKSKLKYYLIQLLIALISYINGTEVKVVNVSEKTSYFNEMSFFESLSLPAESAELDILPKLISSVGQCFAFCHDEALVVCSKMQFLDVVHKRKCDDYFLSYSQNLNENKRKVKCTPIKRDPNEEISVKIYNSSELLSQINFKYTKSYQCTVVLFYAQWCIFSTWMAPHYNALARAFPSLDVVAIDAYNFSHLNSRFGTVAVPSLMIFQRGKVFSKFNESDRSLTSLIAYLSNNTGLEPNTSVVIESGDYEGPISSVLLVQPDYCRWLAWAFLLIFALVKLFNTSRGEAVLNSFIDLVSHQARQQLHID